MEDDRDAGPDDGGPPSFGGTGLAMLEVGQYQDLPCYLVGSGLKSW